MSRSIKKGPYVHPKLAKKVENAVRSNSREVIRTWSRASVIMPDMLGLTVAAVSYTHLTLPTKRIV